MMSESEIFFVCITGALFCIVALQIWLLKEASAIIKGLINIYFLIVKKDAE